MIILALAVVAIVALVAAMNLHAHHRRRRGHCDICGTPVEPGETKCDTCWLEGQW